MDVADVLFAVFVGFLGVLLLVVGIGIGSIVAEQAFQTRDKPVQYEVIKAESKEDAMEKSVWKEGDLARVVGLTASSNSKGTYSVFPEFERIDVGDLDLKKEEE